VPPRALAIPFSRSRSVLPQFVPGGILPASAVNRGTSIFAPSVASLTVTGTFVYKSFPRRLEKWMRRTSTRKYKSPAGAPIVPDSFSRNPQARATGSPGGISPRSFPSSAPGLRLRKSGKAFESFQYPRSACKER